MFKTLFSVFKAVLSYPGFWLTIFGILGCGLPVFAFAAAAPDSSMMTPPPGDISMSMFITPVFQNAASPLVMISLAFNSGVMMIGGLFVTYTLTMGTMHTAHDGEMLGKQWSSMWVPFRTALGSSMVMPLTAKGLCGAQMLVIYAITTGIGFADYIWAQYAQMPVGINQVGPSIDKTSVDKVTTAALGMFRSNLCVDIMNGLSAGPNGQAFFSGSSYGTHPSQTSSNYIINYGTGNNDSNSSCGSVALKMDAAPSASFNQPPTQISAVVQQITQAKIQALQDLDASMKKLADKYLSAPNSPPPLSPTIESSVDTYLAAMSQAVSLQTASQSNPAIQDLQDSSANQGWLLAGTWFMKIVSFQNAISSVTKDSPFSTYSVPSSFTQSNEATKASMAAFKEIQDETKQLENVNTDAGGANVALKNSVGGATNNSPNGIIDEYLLNPILNAIMKGGGILFSSNSLIVGQDTSNAGITGISPILSAQSLGDSLTDAGWLATGVLSGAWIASELSKTTLAEAGSLGTSEVIGGTLRGALDVITPIAIPIIFALFIEGAMLSVVLPMTPYVIWLGVIVAWMVACIEAFFAAPLWAVIHLHPEGNDAAGRGGQGYMMLFSLTVRPALMILGLIAAFVLMSVSGAILNMSLKSAVTLNIGGIGVVSLIAIIFVYIGLMTMIIKTSIGMVHVIPDKLLSWIGGHGGDLSSSAGQASQVADSAHQKGAAAIIGGQQAIRNAQGGFGQRQAGKDRAQQQKDRIEDRADAEVKNDEVKARHKEMVDAMSSASGDNKKTNGED